MSEDGGEKTHDPTQGKLDEARRKGDIPRSQDVNAAAAYLGLLAALLALGAWSADRVAAALMVFIDQPDRLMGMILGPGGPGLSAAIVGEAALGAAPLLLAPAAMVAAALFAQQAVAVAYDKLAPKGSRLSLIANARHKLGPSGLVEFGKAFAKLLAIAGALTLMLRRDLDGMIGAASADPRVIGAMIGAELVKLLSVAAAIAGVIAALDLVWQRYDHRRKLRMSLQEVKEEMKSSEGDPHVKAQRRARAQEVAMNRMMLDVPKADVVIVNPTHYAVALKWSRAKGSAPVCVAKGVDEAALRIRALAESARIPVHADAPTARALHATVEVGREIAPEHYKAVAAAVRFADRIRRAAKARGTA